jgi:hypothetical protein
MKIEISWRKDRYLVERKFEGVVIDDYTTKDLAAPRKHAEWAKPVWTAAAVPLGTTCPDPDGSLRMAELKHKAEAANLRRMLKREDVCLSMKKAIRRELLRGTGEVVQPEDVDGRLDPFICERCKEDLSSIYPGITAMSGAVQHEKCSSKYDIDAHVLGVTRVGRQALAVILDELDRRAYGKNPKDPA